jgi:DNA-binding NarL/FixJ family response regulator
MPRNVADDVLDCLAPLEAIAREMLDDDDEEVRRTAARALKAAAQTRVLVGRGDLRAVIEALDAGVQVGILSREPHTRLAAVIADADARQETWPDAHVGRRVSAGNPSGRPLKVPHDLLRTAVLAKLHDGSSLKRARSEVAKLHKVSVSTVERATRHIRK